jgi:glycosyltransferase involved in cell wall biosynthesis
VSTRVTVVTATWNRHELLLDRCIPSVQAQDVPVDHLVVCDGPDPELREMMALGAQLQRQPSYHPVLFRELPEHDFSELHYGHHCRAYACELVADGYITYCDDDDALRPEHCRLLAEALDEHPEAGFAVSQMCSHGPHGDTTIGVGPVACGNVGTPMIMHRRELLDVAGWDHSSAFEDWELVWAWMQADISHVRVWTETVDVWPSLYR